MTALAPGIRVRLLPSVRTLHAGRVGTLHHQLRASGKWRVDLDGVDSYGRTLWALCEESELVVLDGDSKGEAE